MQCMDGRAWMLEFPMQRAPTHVWIFTACLRRSHSAGFGLFSLNEPNITWKCWAPDLSTAAHAESVRVRMYPLRKLLLRHFNLPCFHVDLRSFTLAVLLESWSPYGKGFNGKPLWKKWTSFLWHIQSGTIVFHQWPTTVPAQGFKLAKPSVPFLNIF